MTSERPSRAKSRRWLLLLLLVPLAFVDWSVMWQWAAYERPQEIGAGFAVATLRRDWLPGRPISIPVQSCPSCQREEHDRCSSRTRRIDLNLDFSQTSWKRVEVASPFEERRGPEGISLVVVENFWVGGTPVGLEAFRCSCCEP